MEIRLRPGTPADAEACGQICYAAFHGIATRHGFPPDFASPEVGCGVASMLLSHPGFYSVVAEREGRVVGSNFLDERSPIAGVGPITIDPAAQDTGVGRRLMLEVLRRADERGFPGVRLVQAAYHNRSLSLYARLGFEVREPLANLQGRPPGLQFPGYTVRNAAPEDLEPCSALCFQVHGHHRAGELRDSIEHGGALVVEHDGRICGYTAGLGFLAHTVALTNTGLKALISAAPEYSGPGFLLPMRNAELFRWCLENGLKVVQTLNLMSRGLYNEPKGAWLPSVGF